MIIIICVRVFGSQKEEKKKKEKRKKKEKGTVKNKQK